MPSGTALPQNFLYDYFCLEQFLYMLELKRGLDSKGHILL
jgi:hypothetical protein